MCTFEQQTVYQVLSGGIEVILEVDGQSKVTFTPRTEQPFLYFWQTATIQGFDTLLAAKHCGVANDEAQGWWRCNTEVH